MYNYGCGLFWIGLEGFKGEAKQPNVDVFVPV